MPHHGALRRIAIAILVLPVLAACDGGNPQQKQSPTADPTHSSPSPTASSPTPSPTPTASWTEMTLKTSQRKFVSYYDDYIDSAREPAKGGPPAKLTDQTVPGSPERNWLKASYADGRRTGGYVASGDVEVTLGPETSANARRTHVKFRACVDPGDLKIKVGGETKGLGWQLMNVEMRTKAGASRATMATDPSAWLVYSTDAFSDKKCGY